MYSIGAFLNKKTKERKRLACIVLTHTDIENKGKARLLCLSVDFIFVIDLFKLLRDLSLCGVFSSHFNALIFE